MCVGGVSFPGPQSSFMWFYKRGLSIGVCPSLLSLAHPGPGLFLCSKQGRIPCQPEGGDLGELLAW